ncbi:uncharacterized protein LOC132691119 isoform X2 [Panthera onca]
MAEIRETPDGFERRIQKPNTEGPKSTCRASMVLKGFTPSGLAETPRGTHRTFFMWSPMCLVLSGKKTMPSGKGHAGSNVLPRETSTAKF